VPMGKELPRKNKKGEWVIKKAGYKKKVPASIAKKGYVGPGGKLDKKEEKRKEDH